MGQLNFTVAMKNFTAAWPGSGTRIGTYYSEERAKTT